MAQQEGMYQEACASCDEVLDIPLTADEAFLNQLACATCGPLHLVDREPGTPEAGKILFPRMPRVDALLCGVCKKPTAWSRQGGFLTKKANYKIACGSCGTDFPLTERAYAEAIKFYRPTDHPICQGCGAEALDISTKEKAGLDFICPRGCGVLEWRIVSYDGVVTHGLIPEAHNDKRPLFQIPHDHRTHKAPPVAERAKSLARELSPLAWSAAAIARDVAVDAIPFQGMKGHVARTLVRYVSKQLLNEGGAHKGRKGKVRR